jgi:hypothetical protein
MLGTARRACLWITGQRHNVIFRHQGVPVTRTHCTRLMSQTRKHNVSPFNIDGHQ